MNEPNACPGLFRREGEYWTISCEGRLIRLRHTKGLGYLACLLREPGRTVPVAELSGLAGPDPTAEASDGGAERRRVAVTKAIRTALRRIAENDPLLGERLALAVRTGRFCSYEPAAGCPERWEE